MRDRGSKGLETDLFNILIVPYTIDIPHYTMI